tara:strand:- start:516 stop:647 length:132 start_codon:yes stop_codon:yes gene_type:complete
MLAKKHLSHDLKSMKILKEYTDTFARLLSPAHMLTHMWEKFGK